MDGTQQQIVNLNRKVDQLHDIVERMSYQITALISAKQLSSTEKQLHRQDLEPLMISDTSNNGSYSLSMMEHKDIIQDDSHKGNMTNGSNDPNWSSDIQIRRLTAQLTAAYNRIAALEEQLLSYRIHS
ncbi:hypothetical protein C7H19_10350 [Aphanothece hegewaldii CCALA 016]|uniref:Uncharacterized protein n=1 Tax=Aphanothece hegewaldii CCALA 016 TaxID=2107694 RepID=A0A2T1LYT1_9CHRO|nr:hypothetical protein [Aphanothece hegewaldii]PSF37557.1 hypothetical protein C7H19_10350 [Aphanothece hegewaldii CCALA 016]